MSDQTDTAHPETQSRVLLVANRIAASIKRSDCGKYEYSPATGGLVSGLAGMVKTTKFRWYGWAGVHIPQDEIPECEAYLKTQYDTIPIWLDTDLAQSYYTEFCNQVLWPLLHYQPEELAFTDAAWSAYTQANRIFAKAIAKDVQDGDMIWINDYHMMLLPKMLREEIGDSKRGIKMGFFLHTSFPSCEMYRILPVREVLLQGVLHCDLVGFHTYDFAGHFLNSCSRILKLPTTPTGVEYAGRFVTVGAFPIGIDPDRFVDGLKTETVQKRISELEEALDGKKMIIGIDRLDYVKGVPQKMHSFEVFLTEHPEWNEKLVLLQVAVPSRLEVAEYQVLRSNVDELVGHINGKFSTAEHVPIRYLHRSIPFEEMLALYAVSDACFVTSIRDGMNLVAFEYIASQEKRKGSLILSAFTGAAQSLNGSLIVNPWNTDDLVNAIHDALTMSDEQRAINHQKLWKYVSKYTSVFWGESFVAELARASAYNQSRLVAQPVLVPNGEYSLSEGTSNTDSEIDADKPIVVNGDDTHDNI